MRLSTFLITLVVAVTVFVLVRGRPHPDTAPKHGPHPSTLEASPVCPWREPQRDLLALFPPATNYVLETRILSGATSELRQRLGRHMTTDENPLRIYRVRNDGQLLGSVLVTRVKAEHGGIEIVTGIEPRGAVRGVIIQSQREPETIAQILTGAAFRASFAGKDSLAPLRVGEDLPAVPAEARVSAQAVADGVRSQLIVLSVAEKPLATR